MGLCPQHEQDIIQPEWHPVARGKQRKDGNSSNKEKYIEFAFQVGVLNEFPLRNTMVDISFNFFVGLNFAVEFS